MTVATLIASETLASGQLSQALLSQALDCLSDAGIGIERNEWIEKDRVADIYVFTDVMTARTALLPMAEQLDYAVQDEAHRHKKLLISDMDSTMINVECIDELADYAGIKDQIAEVTEAAMQGKLDFEEALRARVALLKGLERRHIQTCLNERVGMTKGAKILVQTMASRGAQCVLVSGGFNQFASSVAQELGFHSFHANELGIIDDILIGEVWGQIVDAQRKQDILYALIAENGWSAADTMAVGDGANDIPMIEAAGMGAAFKAKAAAEAAADMMIRHGDLTTLLSVQGIARSDWIV